MKFRLHSIVLAQGLGTSAVRGMGGIIDEKYADIWYENGFVWVKPRVNTGSGLRMRSYHPASVEMYPYEEDVPAAPAREAAPLKAVAGGAGGGRTK